MVPQLPQSWKKYAAAMQGKNRNPPGKANQKKARSSQGITRRKRNRRGNPQPVFFFSQDIINQLNVVFSRMEGNLQLDLHLDSRPVSQELKGYMTELEKYTDKLTVQEADSASDSAALLPFVEVLTASGEKTGLAFHGVPGDTSLPLFILGLYNAAGPGQPLDPAIRERILAIDHKVHMQILVSLSCTMCPDLVVAAQRIASFKSPCNSRSIRHRPFPGFKGKIQRYERPLPDNQPGSG